MKLRRRECWRRKMYLILCFRSEEVNEALSPDSPRVIWVGLTLINLKLSPDSALQCVLQGGFRGGLFLSLILSTHTHTHTLSGIPSSLLKRSTICGGTLWKHWAWLF